MPTRPFAPRRSFALAAMAATLAAGSADADLEAGREIIRTGDRVPGLGRIGTLTAAPLAIDPAGRVLVAIYLGDGSRAVALADGGDLVSIWRQHSVGNADAPDILSARVSPDGTRVAALGGPQLTGADFSKRVLYDLSTGTARPLLTAGDHTLDGTTVLGLINVTAVSDDGVTLLMGRIPSSSGDPSGSNAVLLRDAAGTRVVVADGDAHRFRFVQPIGLTDDGTAVVTGCDADNVCSVLRDDPDGTFMPLIAAGDAGPDGGVVGSATGVAVAPKGDVLANVTEADGTRLLVRSERGALVRVRAESDPFPDGGAYEVAGGYLNASGVVTLPLLHSGDPVAIVSAIAVYPPQGTPQVVAGGSGGQINDAGQVGLRLEAPGEPVRLGRWHDGALQTLLTARSALHDGTSAAANGIRGGCLDDEGRVATFLDAVDGTQGWACIDSTGAHVRSPMTTTGAPLRPVACAFAGEGEIVGLVDGHVVRVGKDSQEVVAVGDSLPDGSGVREIRGVDANPDGTLVAVADTKTHEVALRQARGGALDEVAFRLPGGEQVYGVSTAGIASDGTIVAAVALQSGLALVATDELGGRILLDNALAGEPLTPFALHVRGMAAVASLYRQDGTQRHFLFDLTAGTYTEILQPDTLPGAHVQVDVLDLAASGDVLYRTTVVNELSATTSDTWLWRNGSSELVSHRDSPYSDRPQPFLVNAMGNLLQYAPTVWSGRTRLSLSGPPVAAACPGQTTTAADSDGCQIDRRANATWWPLLPLAAALTAARRRRAVSLAFPTGTS